MAVFSSFWKIGYCCQKLNTNASDLARTGKAILMKKLDIYSVPKGKGFQNDYMRCKEILQITLRTGLTFYLPDI